MIIEFMVHHQGGEGGYDSSPNGGIGREGAGHFAPASHRDRPTHAPTHPPNHPRTQPPTHPTTHAPTHPSSFPISPIERFWPEHLCRGCIMSH